MGMGREVETGHALSLRGAVAFEADKRAGLQRMTATAGRGAPCCCFVFSLVISFVISLVCCFVERG